MSERATYTRIDAKTWCAELPPLGVVRPPLSGVGRTKSAARRARRRHREVGREEPGAGRRAGRRRAPREGVRDAGRPRPVDDTRSLESASGIRVVSRDGSPAARDEAQVSPAIKRTARLLAEVEHRARVVARAGPASSALGTTGWLSSETGGPDEGAHRTAERPCHRDEAGDAHVGLGCFDGLKAAHGDAERLGKVSLRPVALGADAPNVSGEAPQDALVVLVVHPAMAAVGGSGDAKNEALPRISAARYPDPNPWRSPS